MHDKNNTPSLQGPAALQRLLVEAALLKRLYAAHADFKAEVAKTFTPGDKSEVTNAQGLKLGSVSMSSPNRRAVCHDRAILLAMADEQGYEIVDSLPAPDSEQEQALLDYLTDNAPEYLDSSVTADDHKAMAEQVLEEWQITGTLPTGWTIEDASTPRFSVTPGRAKAAVAAIDHLVGQVDDLLAITDGKDGK